jgi:hypothetical protein
LSGSTATDTFDEEVRFHLDERTAQHVRLVMNAQDTRAETTRRFGNMTLMKERTDDAECSAGWTYVRDVWSLAVVAIWACL